MRHLLKILPLALIVFILTKTAFPDQSSAQNPPDLSNPLTAKFIQSQVTNGSQIIVAKGNHPDSTNAFAQGRFIVKFKSSLTQCAHCLLAKKQKFSTALTDGSDSLDLLNQKVGVQSARALFVPKHESTTAAMKDDLSQELSEAKTRFSQRALRAPVVTMPDLSNTYILNVPQDANIEEICELYRRDPHVEYAQPDYQVKTNALPNDPYFSSSKSWGQTYDDLWGLKKIQAAQAWDRTQGESMVVAVVDTGADMTHPDLAANIWSNPLEIPNNGIDDDNNGFIDDVHGWNFVENTNDPTDHFGHGTHVSGTIAAVGNNGLGIVGVAPKAKIMPVKGLDDSGSGYISVLANAIIYAAQNGADVINNSWGPSFRNPSNPVIEDAIRTAYGLGTIVVFAAGNGFDDVAYYSPLNMTDSKPIVVAASTEKDEQAFFSNYGATVDIAAPGAGTYISPPNFAPFRNILSLKSAVCAPVLCDPNLIVGGNYVRQAGTSMAAPHVSGAAAIILSAQPTFTTDDVLNTLRASSDDILSPGKDPQSGFGRLNLFKAIQQNKVVILSSSNAKLVDTSGDGLFSPGETVRLNLTIQNNWIPATNVEATLSSSNPNFIANGTVALGNMTHGEKRDISFQFQISASAPEFQPISLSLKLSASGMTDRNESLERLGEVVFPSSPQPPSLSGWPASWQFSLGFASPISELAIGDLNNDGSLEVITVSPEFSVRVYDRNGKLMPGWPQSILPIGGDGFHIKLGDIDGNGTLEIFTGFQGFYANGTPIPGWPKVLAGCTLDSVKYLPIATVADLDGDGKAEVIGSQPRGVLSNDPTYQACWPGSQVYIWDGQGRPLPNMPIKTPTLNLQGILTTEFLSPPVVGDLDSDGNLDVVFLGSASNINNMNLVHLYAYDRFGQPLPGWPKDLSQPGSSLIWDSPTIGDLDGDGKDEVITALSLLGQNGKIFAFHGNGLPVTGWPRGFETNNNPNFASPDVTLADLDQDNKPEIIVQDILFASDSSGNTNLSIHVFKADGTELAGWPKIISGYTESLDWGFGDFFNSNVQQTIVGDVNGDGRPDLLRTASRYDSTLQRYFIRIFAWQADGSPVAGFPFEIPDSRSTSLFLTDLDQDGTLELGMGAINDNDATSRIYMWHLAQPFSPAINFWPMYGHDFGRTYHYAPKVKVNHPPVPNAGLDQTVSGGETVMLDGSLSSDPDGQPLSYSWTQTSGPEVKLSSTTIAKPTFTAPMGPISLTFQLTVSDGSLKAADSVVVNVAANAAPLKAVYLGQDEDKIGPGNSGPNGTPDNHIRLTNVGKTIQQVRVSNASSGVWVNPYNNYNWNILVVPNGTTADLWFEPYGISTFTVTVTFSDGTIVQVTTTNNLSNNSAAFVKTDTTTQGTWQSVYGSDGYAMANYSTNLPSYVQMNVTGAYLVNWADSTSDLRALQKAGSSDRIAAAWDSGNNFTYDLNLTDNQIHPVALYLLDWDGGGVRSQTIEIRDAETNAVLDPSRSESNFNNGHYLVWDIKGHVKIIVTNTNLLNAVVSGIFFGRGDTTNNPLTAVYLGQDQDKIGPGNSGPNGTPDNHIRLTNVGKTIQKVRVSNTSSGVWENPYNNYNWDIVVVQNGTTADLWFEPAGDRSFTVAVTYSDGTTAQVTCGG